MNSDFRLFTIKLRRNGYYKIRTRGSHFIYSNGVNEISINHHPNKMVIRRLTKENNLK